MIASGFFDSLLCQDKMECENISVIHNAGLGVP